MANKIQTFNNRHGDTFCIKPFTEVATTTLGGVKLCCRSGPIDFHEYYSKEKSIKQVFNNNEGLVKARRDLLAGKKIEQCQACWNDEQAGKVSMRINATENFERIDAEFIKDISDPRDDEADDVNEEKTVTKHLENNTINITQSGNN